MKRRIYQRRLPLAEFWVWLETELAWETEWKRSAWVKWDLDNVRKSLESVQ